MNEGSGMSRLSVVCWKWGHLFSATYVNRLKLALRKHLQLEHQLYCVTDDPEGIDHDICLLPITEFKDSPRCRRRLKQFDKNFAALIGTRILSIDLDVVITGDLTPLVDRPEPLVCWKVGYARVFSGSFILYDHDVLHGLYETYALDPIGFPRFVQSRGVPSDQAMLNYYLYTRSSIPVAQWTEADGIVTYFGEGYERFEHLGVGPGRPQLPPGARLVVLGSADKSAMDEGRYPWVREHWTSLEGVRA